MNRIVFISLILVNNSFFNTLVSQEFNELDQVKYIAQYQYNFQIDSSDVSINEAKLMSLYIGKMYSKYEHSNNFVKDSLINKHKNEDPNSATLKIMPALSGNRSHFFTKYQVIKNFANNTVQLKEKIGTSHLNYTLNNSLSWTLVKSDSIILGQQCKMAITNYAGREYIAWYTTNIPLQDGPYIFCGLPGLIMTIKSKDKQHQFELVAFNPINYTKPILDIKNKYQDISIEAYIKAKQINLQSQIEKFTDPSMTPDPNIALQMRVYMLKNNNFIERL